MLRTLFYRLSIKQRYLVRRLFYLPLDIWNTVFKKNKESMIPPKGKVFTGSGDFYKQGKEQLIYLKQYTNITPLSKVLDIGSGIGRTAVGLTSFLDDKGTYNGFDVVKSGVDWCVENITSKYPNFKFDLLDVHNDLYHSSEKKAINITFNYPNNSFDIVFLFSVFTHMELPEITHYLKEIYRVLKPNSYCLATFFLYENKEEAMHNKNFEFPFEFSNYRLMDKNVKGANIAINQDYLLALTKEIGFSNEKLIKGYWSGIYPKKENNFQDILVLKK